jgi:signal transduction histidine kinase
VIVVAALCGWVWAMGAGLLAASAWRRLDRRKEAIARACHELRGPLTAVRLGLDLCARSGEIPPARLRAIDLELARAGLVLDDLTAGGLGGGAGRPPREQVDVEQLLMDSVEAWRASAAARQVALKLDWCGARVYVGGERLRLAQATGNLIANAIEHGGGDVLVRGRVERGTVRIEVVDDGPGLPAPVAELARRPHGGRGRRGRGVAIALDVAHAHGGRLAAAPSDRGARLVLELPVCGGASATVAG